MGQGFVSQLILSWSVCGLAAPRLPSESHGSLGLKHVRAHVGEPGNETADALAKAAVEKVWMCGATPVVLRYARDAYAKAVSAEAGADAGRPPNQTRDQMCTRQPEVQPGVRMPWGCSWVLALSALSELPLARVSRIFFRYLGALDFR